MNNQRFQQFLDHVAHFVVKAADPAQADLAAAIMTEIAHVRQIQIITLGGAPAAKRSYKRISMEKINMQEEKEEAGTAGEETAETDNPAGSVGKTITEPLQYDPAAGEEKAEGDPEPDDTETEAEKAERFRKLEVIANKELRVALDAPLQRLKCFTPSEERTQAKNRLIEAIMWLGKDQQRLNNPNPYPESYNPANAVVHPTADGLKM